MLRQSDGGPGSANSSSNILTNIGRAENKPRQTKQTRRRAVQLNLVPVQTRERLLLPQSRSSHSQPGMEAAARGSRSLPRPLQHRTAVATSREIGCRCCCDQLVYCTFRPPPPLDSPICPLHSILFLLSAASPARFLISYLPSHLDRRPQPTAAKLSGSSSSPGQKHPEMEVCRVTMTVSGLNGRISGCCSSLPRLRGSLPGDSVRHSTDETRPRGPRH